MPEPLAHRCATESAARDEPLAGTASRVERWLVVEQPGAWGPDALAQSDLDPDVGRQLAAAARDAGVRVLLARQPGWRKGGARRRVFLARSRPDGRWIERLDLPADDPAALLALDLGALAAPRPPGAGTPGPRPLFLVCTHGRHDPCCADRGRPLIRRLAGAGRAGPAAAARTGGGDSGADPTAEEASIGDVWETSHIGGDRFAGNVLCLPEGVYYGRVDTDRAPGLVADHRSGLLDLDRYRGLSCHPPLVQVAEAHARATLGERRLDGMTVLAAEAGAGGQVTVRVAQRGGPTLEVVVGRERAEPVQLTCHAPEMAAPWRYVVRSTRRLTPTR